MTILSDLATSELDHWLCRPRYVMALICDLASAALGLTPGARQGDVWWARRRT